MLNIKPGHGWNHLGGSVYEHPSGTRIHLGGLVRLPDLSFISLNKWPEGNDGWRHISICGGNRKRGLMAWAVNLVGSQEKVKPVRGRLW